MSFWSSLIDLWNHQPYMNEPHIIKASPIRIIPFDLGRSLSDYDVRLLMEAIVKTYELIELNERQKSLMKELVLTFRMDKRLSFYVYKSGICVAVINEDEIVYSENLDFFAIEYGINRKTAHADLFAWKHDQSESIRGVIRTLRKMLERITNEQEIRPSAKESFENQGMSYVMTLSMFDFSEDAVDLQGFKKYPEWLRKNVYALLDPSLLYLEDSNKFESDNLDYEDLKKLLRELDVDEEPFDYEKHRHMSTYMSWAAVILLGNIHTTDKDEYVSLEIQLQSDWYYIYCIEKSLTKDKAMGKRRAIILQRLGFEVETLKNRIFDFDDTSIPTRVLGLQKGLVDTSGLENNIDHLLRNIKYLFERERLENELKQKRLGLTSEVFLFLIAFIEIAPVVAEFGNHKGSYLGYLTNAVLLVAGITVLIRKD